jgi:hypothetical protein
VAIGKERYIVLDMRDGMYESSKAFRHLTAVRTVHGLVQYVMTIMGLRNAVAPFQRLKNSVYE